MRAACGLLFYCKGLAGNIVLAQNIICRAQEQQESMLRDILLYSRAENGL